MSLEMCSLELWSHKMSCEKRVLLVEKLWGLHAFYISHLVVDSARQELEVSEEPCSKEICLTFKTEYFIYFLFFLNSNIIWENYLDFYWIKTEYFQNLFWKDILLLFFFCLFMWFLLTFHFEIFIDSQGGSMHSSPSFP